jgi:hypothetical protein
VPEGLEARPLAVAILSLLIQVLIVLLVLAVVYYIAKLACTHFGAPPVILQILGLILLLIFLAVLLNLVAGVGPRWRWP